MSWVSGSRQSRLYTLHKEAVMGSSGQLIIQSVVHFAGWSVGQWIIRSVDHWISWSLDQLIIRSVDHWISWSLDQVIIGSVDHCISWSLYQLIIRSVDHSITFFGDLKIHINRHQQMVELPNEAVSMWPVYDHRLADVVLQGVPDKLDRRLQKGKILICNQSSCQFSLINFW